MAIRDEINDAIEEMQADNTDLDEGAQKFLWWNDVEIECIPSSLERGLSVVFGGKEVIVRLSIYVLRSHFLSADSTLFTVDDTLQYTGDDNKPHPISGRKLTFRGKEYRIFTVTEDPSRSYYKAMLVDWNSGR